MKRDMDLIRKILFSIEDQYIDVELYNIKIEGYDFKTVAYHCEILHEAGLLSDYGSSYADNEIYFFSVGHLTWEGHEFLDIARNETIWRKSLDTVKDKGGNITLDILKNLLVQLTQKMLLG